MTDKREPDSPQVYFEVRFVGPQVAPDKVPLRAVSDALSALQDLASGRDPYLTSHVPPDKSLGLVKVRRGSAVYQCVSRSPLEATRNLSRIGSLLSDSNDEDADDLVPAFRAIQSLSEVAKSVDCRIEVKMSGRRSPLFVIADDDFDRISKRLLLTGETAISGTLERIGGVTANRCILHVPGRNRALYCDVKDRELSRRLGNHLYENIVAQGTAVWIYKSWRIFKFTINNFSQPRLGNAVEAIDELRKAGLNAWDPINDPEAFLKECHL